jgi:hypothetical protein
LYINHSGAPNGVFLTVFDRDQFWVGKALEIRALDERHVFILLFWLYWPEELPSGRKHHFGKQELLMSNHLEIVDATTVAGKANVTRWNEYDDNDDENGEKTLGGLYWRLWYNYRTGRISVSSLSSLLYSFCNLMLISAGTSNSLRLYETIQP